ncbi:hypothetical protein [Salinimicrobium oceani]|uniref:Uncharacterized protein n=1 Tax=Salinimicrobium oceani TaxID=2722702 RepID=A0ABX1CXI0_9FLAO|nr:hypothetical protein [Salinimicrobium oceani]NJW52507.1 hypothetical protein [Salinimicrobium oceani]
MMEYVLSGIAGIAVFFLVLLFIYNRRQEAKIRKNIRDIKKIQTSTRDYFNFD